MDSDIIARIAEKLEGQYLDSIEAEHHEYCRMRNVKGSTCCNCVYLRKADRDAALEEKYDRMEDR